MVDVENGDKRERKNIGRSDGSRVLTVSERDCRRNVLRDLQRDVTVEHRDLRSPTAANPVHEKVVSRQAKFRTPGFSAWFGDIQP